MLTYMMSRHDIGGAVAETDDPNFAVGPDGPPLTVGIYRFVPRKSVQP